MTQPPGYPGSPDPDSGGDPHSGETPSWENGGNQQPPSYDQPQYGQPQYGQPVYGQEQYGQPAYGQPAYQGSPYGTWQGGNDASHGTDGVSIAALVLNLTPCGLVIPGWICAIIGLGRTKRNGTKGRWMAITSLVMGLLWALLIGLLAIGGVWLFKNVVTPGNAEVGQCVNVSTSDDNEIGLMKADCDDGHDGEIVVVHDVTSDDLESVSNDLELCRRVLGEDSELMSAVEERINAGDVQLKGVVEDPPPSAGETLVCYVEAKDGDLTEKINP